MTLTFSYSTRRQSPTFDLMPLQQNYRNDTTRTIASSFVIDDGKMKTK